MVKQIDQDSYKGNIACFNSNFKLLRRKLIISRAHSFVAWRLSLSNTISPKHLKCNDACIQKTHWLSGLLTTPTIYSF